MCFILFSLIATWHFSKLPVVTRTTESPLSRSHRHYFINDEADYYNDISASAGAHPSDAPQRPKLTEEDVEWQSWLDDQTRSWQVQKRVNEQRAEEERRAGQSDGATAIMRRQMEEYQQQMQTWMTEMNDWMKTQSLTQEKLREMRQMIKAQMEQVRQVAQSAEYMASHGPGNPPADPAAATPAPGAPSQHPQAPPQYGAPPTASLPKPGAPEIDGPKMSSLPGGTPAGLPTGSQPPLGPDAMSLPPPHGLPAFDPMRPPPMFQPGRGPVPQGLPPNFQPQNPPPGFKPVSINPTAPGGGAPLRPPLGSPPMAPTTAMQDGANEESAQKYKPCFNFRRGICKLSEEECPYSHSIEKSDKPCIAFNQAACRFDAECCTYLHECKNCGGPEPAVKCECDEQRLPDKLSGSMVMRLKKRFYWKEMEAVAKGRGEKGGLWRNNRSPSPDICVKWNDRGLFYCPLKSKCR